MRSVSETIEEITPSTTIEMNNRSKEMIASGLDVISLAVGEPDFPTPPHIIQAAIDALNRGETHYAPSRGIPELTQAVAYKLIHDNHIETTQKQIIITDGAKNAIFTTMMAILNKGDEVVIIDPSWVSYEPCVRIAGGRAVHHSLNTDFQVDESLYNAITDRTKMIIVNTPSNPTGSILDRSSLQLISDVCTDRDLFCLSDEIYEKLIYRKEHISIATVGDMLERTITINGFSKAYAMTGWRLGYLSAPLDIVPIIDRVIQHSTSCVNTFAMWGGVAALNGDQSYVEEMRRQFSERRKYVINRFSDMGLSTAPADGAFYAFIHIGGDDVSTANAWLNKTHVATTPGTAFKASGWIRISYATSMKLLAEALDRIEAAL